ncbi:hypothetical protein [Streptomyces sp. AM6-12]
MAARTKPDSPVFGGYALDLGVRTARMMRDWAADTAAEIERRAAGGPVR